MVYRECCVVKFRSAGWVVKILLTSSEPSSSIMALDDQPGERQPVQRRVSYRRLRGEDNSEGNAGNGGGGSNLDSHSGPDGTLPKAAAASLVVALVGSSGYDRCTREGYDLDGRDADATDALTSISNPYGSLSTTTPKSIWHEIWLAAR